MTIEKQDERFHQSQWDVTCSMMANYCSCLKHETEKENQIYLVSAKKKTANILK